MAIRTTVVCDGCGNEVGAGAHVKAELDTPSVSYEGREVHACSHSCLVEGARKRVAPFVEFEQSCTKGTEPPCDPEVPPTLDAGLLMGELDG